jgi:hypothetical protein
VLSDVEYNIKMVSVGSLVIEKNLPKQQISCNTGFYALNEYIYSEYITCKNEIILLVVVLIVFFGI